MGTVLVLECLRIRMKDIRANPIDFQHKNSLSFFSCAIFHHGHPSEDGHSHLVIRRGCHPQAIAPLCPCRQKPWFRARTTRFRRCGRRTELARLCEDECMGPAPARDHLPLASCFISTSWTLFQECLLSGARGSKHVETMVEWEEEFSLKFQRVLVAGSSSAVNLHRFLFTRTPDNVMEPVGARDHPVLVQSRARDWRA